MVEVHIKAAQSTVSENSLLLHDLNRNLNDYHKPVAQNVMVKQIANM